LSQRDKFHHFVRVRQTCKPNQPRSHERSHK
jgi:hypothetical protein